MVSSTFTKQKFLPNQKKKLHKSPNKVCFQDKTNKNSASRFKKRKSDPVVNVTLRVERRRGERRAKMQRRAADDKTNNNSVLIKA